MDVERTFRLLRRWLGALLCAAWAATWLVATVPALVACRRSHPDYACGDFLRGATWVGWIATPLLLWGLPLLATSLPRRPDPGARLGAGRRLLEICSYVLALGFGVFSLYVVPALGTGAGVETLFFSLAGTAAVCALSGKRVRR